MTTVTHNEARTLTDADIFAEKLVDMLINPEGSDPTLVIDIEAPTNRLQFATFARLLKLLYLHPLHPVIITIKHPESSQ